MQAILFNSHGNKVESLLFANENSIINYLQLAPEVAYVVFIEKDDHLNGEVRLLDDKIIVGHFQTKVSEITISGNFNYRQYEGIDFIEDTPENIFKINQNLIHIYNGGNEEYVPYPMPYSITNTVIEEVFIPIDSISSINKFSREYFIKE